MYAPRPQTHQIPRHYTTHTHTKRTQQKDKDKENTNAGLPTKTPSRAALGAGTAGKMLAPNTTARVGLGAAGTQKRQEGKGKGKEGVMDDIAPKRLFTSSKSYSSLNQSTSHSRSHSVARTPARGLLQLSTTVPPATLAQQTPLPSASKPRRSSRRSTSVSLTPAPAPAPTPAPVYQTPAPKQWDEGNSLDSISEGLNELALGPSAPAPILEEVVEEEEDGEPEYMPPHDDPLPYEPVGPVPSVEAEIRLINDMPPLWSMASAWRHAQAPPSPELDRPIDVHVSFCDEDELEEPMFRVPKPKLPVSRPTSVVSTSGPVVGRTAKTATTSATTNRRPIPTTRLVKPAPPAPTGTGSSRITKPPVPRLAPRPPSQLRAAPPRAPVPALDFDQGIMGETHPLFLEDDLSDLDFGSDHVHTP